ncbi:signal peptidase II [Adlercreutzia caecimuris]|uniref:Lipoprotein signal peptidase n=1 Tax=Adlercreutzia caecimuris B7 TaxID=1235794 RepID=R9L1Q4_9ACTN|nr:signal peptidase II [Adlercreutzia caecimuris]EOS52468.1 signal peptidase II [Adlercreutzia caecimuris B7]
MRRRNLCVFAAVVLLWLAADIATKAVCNGYGLGEVIAGPFLGLIQFRLAHNTGAAWGMFDDSTFALGVMSLLVCAALTAYLVATAKRANLAEVIGVALVVAGGLGNALDRFTLGYVVDFIDTTFIEFPTFNVADIGVTCGFVLFFAGMLWGMRRDGLTTACVDAGQPGADDAADEAAGPSGDVPRTGDACGPQGR